MAPWLSAARVEIKSTMFAVVSFTGDNSAAGILRLANNAETIGGLSSFNVGIVENESDSAGTGTLIVNTITPQSFGGTLRDGDGVGTDGTLSLIKTGASTFTFSGTSTHTGPTLVNAGTLTINGSLGAGTLLTIANATVDGFGAIDCNVNVQNGGTLASGGVIGGNISLGSGGTLSGTSLIAGQVTAASGSRISPAGGTSPGTIFTAGLTLGSGSRLDYELGSSGDLVTVTVANGLTINGGAFNVFAPGGVSPLSTNGTYALIDYDLSFTGSITNLSIANSQVGKSYTIVNDTTNTLITLTVIDTTISEWNGGAADGLWSSGGNWSMGVPNAVGAAAKFGMIPAVPTTVAVNGAKTLAASSSITLIATRLPAGQPSPSR
jgi:autotransporter-associated beta strand protein